MTDLVEHRLAYRVGYMKATNLPWQREDRALMEEAWREIERLKRSQSSPDKEGA